MRYNQKTGELFSDKGDLISTGYSGNGIGKNNPEMENVKNIGVLPKGIYAIGVPYDSPHTGRFTLPLIPNPSNQMFKRSGFAIHGDNISNPGTASNGCIILPRKVREAIFKGIDKRLEVF